MSSANVALLGAVAGFTILLGLPIARLRNPAVGVRAFLNATATGILLFLLWDVLAQAVEPVEGALTAAAVQHDAGWLRFAGLATVLTVGLAVGLISLVYYDRWVDTGARRPAAPARSGPGAMAVGELSRVRGLNLAAPARRLALLIATGIGLHNFSEGLAIGQSAAQGEVSLAVLLVIGFALHNATEGFGITAPLAAAADRPGWGFLALMGLIGGGPTFAGTLLGQSFASGVVYLGFLALAAGSILYVIIQLLRVGERLGCRQLLYWGVLLGLALGLGTDFVVTAAGV